MEPLLSTLILHAFSFFLSIPEYVDLFVHTPHNAKMDVTPVIELEDGRLEDVQTSDYPYTEECKTIFEQSYKVTFGSLTEFSLDGKEFETSHQEHVPIPKTKPYLWKY
ncbi:hypothetical protein K432DRAFT_408831 [Lepidopterella palustris CBS 459.81]|uniref:Uncharacterized protein n=1 Tax=Lepidopterella palustris CBS 459.81 TaxID=1314670 RepID=A0A8E2JAW4_9PEZI|nr:hypothetical protein K432DRAFT_408831 [Lepidopterella palustris CBS 459.81]